MSRFNFGRHLRVEPYHDTSGTFIGTTKDAGSAAELAAGDVSLMRIAHDKWPKEINRLKKQVRFVVKEAGCRNFLVVLNEGA